jgi:hypothetical protein
MKGFLRILLYLFGGFLCVAAAAVGAFYWTDGRGMCSNSSVAIYPSPNAAMSVVVFERDCGATTDFSTQASLLPLTKGQAGVKDGGGNLLIIDGNHGAAPQGPGGGPEVRVAWIADDQLVVSYDKAVRVFRAETNLSGVRIRHETLVSKPG